MTLEEFRKCFLDAQFEAVEKYGLGPVESIDEMDSDALEYIMSDEFLERED
jgi:hypothetical protein